MDRSGLQRIIPIVLVLIIVVVAVAALISVGRSLFFGGESSPTPQVNLGKQALTNTAADRSVRMTLRGPIVASENFHSYTITVTPSSRTMTTYVGYMGQQVENSQLDNSIPGYEQFVYALDRANLMEGTPLTGDANDMRGVCATGTLTTYEVMQSSSVIQTLWTSSCKGSARSLDANAAQVSQLFQRQIPTFDQMRQKVRL